MSFKTDVSTSFTGLLQAVKMLSKWRIVFDNILTSFTGLLQAVKMLSKWRMFFDNILTA